MRRNLPFLVVMALPFVFYWKLFHPDPEERVLFRGDFLTQHYVWKSYALARIQQGEIPLWNPHVLGGVPFHANPQAGIFYPPTYLLLPFHENGRVSYLALEAYQLLHQAFAGAGMILLMRSLGVGAAGAISAAIVFMFAGFFTTPGHQSLVLTASWIPWSLHATGRALESRRLAGAAVLALVLALMILAGHPQVAYYGLLLTLAWALFYGGWRRTLRRVAPAILLALGIAAVQLLPTYLLASDSVRAELGYDYSTSFGFSPYFLSAVVAPRGQVRLPDQDGSAPLHVYAGIGALLFAVIGLLLSTARPRAFFGAAALVALLLSFGKDSPLYDFFYAALPGFESFRVPYRILGVWVLGVAVLAGLGIETLWEASRKARLRLRKLAVGAFAVLLALGLWAGDVHLQLLARPGALDPRSVERVVGAAYWAVLLAALNFLLLLLLLWRPRSRAGLAALVAVLAIDLGAFVKDRGQHPYRTLVRAEERPIHRLALAQADPSRYASGANLEGYASLFGTHFAGGHEALADRTYAALLDRSSQSANALSILNVKFLARSPGASSRPWCGARYASPLPLLDVPAEISPVALRLSPPLEPTRLVFYWSPLGPGGGGKLEIDGTSYPLVPGEPLAVDFGEPAAFSQFRILVDEGNPGVRLEDLEVDLNPIGLKADFLELEGIGINLHALPRAYFMVPSDVPSELQTLQSLACWSVHQGIQVLDPSTGEGASGFFRKDVVQILSYEPERIELSAESPRPGYLVLSDTFQPGWEAEVDGEPAPILRAMTAFRATPVPAGRHRVAFVYRPSSLRWGGLVSAVALAGLGIAAVFSLRSRRRPVA